VVDGQGPWQRRLEGIGGIKPLAFGQLGRWGPASKRSLLAWRNEGRMRCMADRYLTENREAAIGVQQMFHMRQRWGSAVWRAQTQGLLRRLKCALPAAGVGGGRVAPGGSGHGGHDGGGQLLYSCRSHASGSDGGGGLGGDSRWGAGYGGDVVRVDRRQSGCLELVLCGGEWRIRSAWPGPPAWGKPVCVCVFLGGELRCLA
jgi:hypothetical protein